MNLVISGSRHWDDYPAFEKAVLDFVNIGAVSMVWAGDATGVDALADKLARNFEIDFCRLHAKWKRDGKRAGPGRNARLSAVPHYQMDRVMAFPGPESRGTYDFIERVKKFITEGNFKLINVDR